MQNQILINSLQGGTCPQCGGPVPHPDVQQQPRVGVNPPQPEFLEVSSDDSVDQELIWRDIQNFMPSDNQPGPAHDLVGVTAEEVTSIVRRAKDEFIIMATTGYPLWILTYTDSNAFHPETLNFGEYLHMSQRGGVAPYFQSEASRHSATIRLSPITIVQILMDVDQWLPVFCSMVTNAQILEVLSPGEEESYKEQKQVMTAEFVLATPKVPAREAQFVRYSHQQLDGSWIVVDVSVDELRQFQRRPTRSICRRRPSGCLIRDMQNGSSMVTWVENVDIQEKDKELHPKLRPFVESGFAFGARRWISTLQQQAERFIYSTGINISPTDSPISPEGRRSLAMTAKKMVMSFCSDTCNSTYHHWTSSNKSRQKTMEVKTNKRRGDPGKPPGLHRTAGCTIELISSHNRVFNYLRDIQNRPQWERISSNSIVHELANFSTGPDPRSCISVLAISGHNDILLLQECSTDETGSFVIYAPIERAAFQSLLCGVEHDIPLMPFGFYILPNVSGSTLDGTLLTIVFQITVKNISKRKAVEVVTESVKETLHKIIEAVN
jgi:homeobox-leucine zipper protein